MVRYLLVILCSILLLCGCSKKVVVVEEEEPVKKIAGPVQETPEKSVSAVDFKTIQELAGRSSVNPEEAIRVSNRMLQEDMVNVLDEQTLNNLEKILMAALPLSNPSNQAVIQRNLGIVNYYNKKYNKARQALQSANESNPRDARTHYYMACLYNLQARLYASKGDQVKSQRAQKRAQIEIDTARKLEPGNNLYRKGLAGGGE